MPMKTKAGNSSTALRLKEDCVLVKGAARSALYDLAEGKVYSLNRAAHRALAALQQGITRRRHRRFIEKVTEMGLVESAAAPVTQAQRTPRDGAKAALEFIWLEVTSHCNLTCLHCYGDCRSASEPDRMNERNWKAVLEQAKAVGCSQVQFIGGEPFLNKDLFRLVEFARKKKYSFIEIFSNLTLLKKEHLPFLRENGVNIAATLYSARPETHDGITRAKGSHAKTLAAIKLLKQRHIPVRVAIIAMKQNQGDLAETVEFLHRLGVQYKLPDPVRPTGRGCSQEIQPVNLPPEFSGQMAAANFWTDRYSFYFNMKYNNCWAGKLAVTATGAVIPCIFARDQIVGNCLSKELKAIVSNKRLQGLWRLTKDHVAVCRSCEYRYACHDCRPLAAGQEGDLYAKSPRCLYDPWQGEWKKE